jgi:hypothetical protein
VLSSNDDVGTSLHAAEVCGAERDGLINVDGTYGVGRDGMVGCD